MPRIEKHNGPEPVTDIIHLFTRLEEAGIKLRVEGDHLKINMHRGNLDPELLAELKEKKAAILRFLHERQADRTGSTKIEAVEKKEYYRLSSAQTRLYILQAMEESSTRYNISGVYVLEGELDRDRLKESFQGLIVRHESLRTFFTLVDGEPVQRVLKRIDFEIEVHEIEGPKGQKGHKGQELVETIIQDFIRPFDLARAPLLRVGLIGLAEEKHFLMVDMHHIISDGVSMGIMIRDFVALYSGETPGRLPTQYKDYADWQNRSGLRKNSQEKESFWVSQFQGDIPVLHLPFDYSRPPRQSFAGNTLGFEIKEKESLALKDLALANDSSLFMVLLAVFYVFLSKLSGQEDIVVGTPIAGRDRTEIESVIGMFVNTLALRHFPVGEKNFTGFLVEVRESTLSVFDYHDYPFDELVDRVVKNRDMSRNPLFDVMFSWQNMDIPGLEIPGLQLGPHRVQAKTAKFDLTLTAEMAGEKLTFSLEYCTSLFKQETIARFSHYYRSVVMAVLKDPEQRLADIEMMDEAEREQVLLAFNDTAVDYPREKLIQEIFAEQVVKSPDRISLVGANGNSPLHGSVSYKELDRKAADLAGELIEKGVLPNSIVGLQVRRSIEMIIGILGILKAGAAYLPLDPDLPEARRQYMLADSGAEVVIGPQTVGANCCSPIQDIGAECKGERQFAPTGLAYIMYTSGSTGQPKGVMVCHGNVIRLVINPNFIDLSAATRLLLTGAPGFDATTFEIWGPLLNGGLLCLVSKETILDAQRLGSTLKNMQINTLWLSAPLFNQLLEQDSRMFNPLTWLLVGGDVLSPVHLNRVRRENKGLTVINGYGPTENTTFSTCLKIGRDYEERIPIGRPISNSAVYILDARGRVQPVGVKGEIWVGGDGLARGYLNNPELTAEKFRPSPSTPATTHHSPLTNRLYRTGDRGRWLDDGTIEFLGRVDDQVKIRGFRIEPGEIEARLLRHPEVKEAVVLAREDQSGEKALCAYLVTKAGRHLESQVLREFLSRSLPDYMIPAHVITLECLPLTVSGKINRKALPEPDIKASQHYVAARDESERRLVSLWAEVLGIEDPQIGITDNFFSLGGHSLKATTLLALIHKKFQVQIRLADFFKSATIAGLSSQIRAAETDDYESLKPTEKKQYYSLSSTQKRLFIIQQLDLQSTAYNSPFMVTLPENVDEDRLKMVFQGLIERHESLRTSFVMVDEMPVQRVHERIDFELEVYELEGPKGHQGHKGQELIETIIQGFVRPFDLTHAPLLRVGLIGLAEEKYLLMVDMHHIITDAASMKMLIREFMALYRGEELPPLQLQYRDFAEWQNRPEVRERLKPQQGFWLETLSGELPVLRLPVDYPRPGTQSFDGGCLGFILPKEVETGLREMAARQGVTLYMLALAVFSIMLAKLSGQEDIIVGSPIAARRHADLEHIVGMFVNTLAMRNFPRGEMGFLEFVGEVKAQTLKAFENQEFPFEELVDLLVVRRDTSRNPLFDAMLNFLDRAGENFDISTEEGGLQNEYENRTAKFDLQLAIVDRGDRLQFSLEYCQKLFKESTSRRFIGYFTKIISEILDNDARRLKEIDILSVAEREELTAIFNQTAKDFPLQKTVHGLFEEQVERTPDHIAVKGPARDLSGGEAAEVSYRQLNERANRLAHGLRKHGVKPNTVVGLMVRRSVDMIVGLLGILKAGGAYLPIDPGYPAERCAYMLADSGVKLILTHYPREELQKIPAGMHVLDLRQPEVYAGAGDNPLPVNTAHDLLYLIYTSGSTGRPKGVMLEHINLVNLLFFSFGHTNLDFSSVLQFTSISFDVSFQEIFSSLLAGGKICLIDEETRGNIEKLFGLIEENEIKTVMLPMSFLKTIFGEEEYAGKFPTCVRHIQTAGEQAMVSDRFRMFLQERHVYLHNHYGPSETHVVTTLTLDPAGVIPESPSIGRPVANTKIYILDKYGRLLPKGVMGEVTIGGVQVGRGYLNNPELTAERFVTSPITNHLYKTGDLGRWLDDGTIEFLGRIDQQVKIRGFRIEPGEIEIQLMNHDQIREAVVAVREDERKEKYLCAYVVAMLPDLDVETLREYLAGILPHYMVPAYFVPLENIPLTPNGKLDRKALPEPEFKIARIYTAPRDKIEQKLAAIWAEVLGREDQAESLPPIGIDDNFFEVGGHSLRAMVLIAKINKFFGVDIRLVEIFEATSTIRDMARLIRAAQWIDREADENIKFEKEIIL